MEFTDKNVPIDYICDNIAIGGAGGSPFTFLKLDEGASLKKIQAWYNSWTIRGVRVFMSDGSEYVVGVCEENGGDTFLFDDGEIITQLQLTAAKKRLGRIYFRTNRNKEYSIGANQDELRDRYEKPVGSGICCGIFGTCGSDVNYLGFAMLRKIKSVVMKNLKYPTMAIQNVATKPETVAHQEFTNGTTIEQTVKMSGTGTVTSTREWSLSTTLSFGVSVEVTGSIPLVAEGTVKTELTMSATSSHSQSSTHSEEKSWEWELKCPPKRKIVGDATMFADSISVDYTADLEICFVNDKVKTSHVKGMYTGLNTRYGNLTVLDQGEFPEPKSGNQTRRITALNKSSANAKILTIHPFPTTKAK